jgi:prolyl-tRNA editing enzyme YbaK/EbsC (Cys-tRNA(Pro) deacylase)
MSTRAVQFLKQKKIPFEIIKADILSFDKILINAGQRGTMLMMVPADIRTTLTCKVARVAES